MLVNVRYWGVTARLAGTQAQRLELPEGATVGDALVALPAAMALAGELQRCAFAVGDEIVPRRHVLCDGAELSILPPVSGG